MAGACHGGVQSGKLMYPRTTGYAPSCVYMSCRPNESHVSEQQTFDRNMSDKNLEQRTNIKFCVKIDKNAIETLDLLILTHGEYTMNKSSVQGKARCAR
jgi:hypothetical protein